MKTTFKIINGNLHEYDSNGKLIHSKNSTGCEEWYEYDSNGKITHYKNSNGYEYWYDYDSKGNLIHYKNSNRCETWYDSNGNKITKKEFDELNSSCDGKIAIIDGKNYQLKLV